MTFRIFLATALLSSPGIAATPASDRPNIVILYADDMGYGDLGIQNPGSKIPTPRLDQLAKEGARFTDAHSSSGICTPSRYALLTGRYHWRKFHGIVGALGNSVFDPARVTLPELLQDSGYDTACIGKWHLGWDWDALKVPGAKPDILERGKRKTTVWGAEDFNWSKPIPDGPLDHGFDHYFGDTVINFPPYAWIEDDRVVDAPDTTLANTAETKEGNWETRPGPARSDWDFYEVLPTLTERATAWLDSRKGNANPFFLYFPLPSPHAPIIPTSDFDGSSEAGGYGDFVTQTDWSCGQLLDALERSGHAGNTLVVFTSDNGPERYAFDRVKKFDHWSAAPLRGLKRDIFEGGHRVPFVVRWPGKIAAGETRDGLVSQIDLMATLASVVGAELPAGSAEDSYNLLAYWLGESAKSPRSEHVHNTYADAYAVRRGDWLLIDAESGSHSKPPKGFEASRGYTDSNSPALLFNLAVDLPQKTNLAEADPDRVRSLRKRLTEIRDAGHSAPRLEQ